MPEWRQRSPIRRTGKIGIRQFHLPLRSFIAGRRLPMNVRLRVVSRQAVVGRTEPVAVGLSSVTSAGCFGTRAADRRQLVTGKLETFDTVR